MSLYFSNSQTKIPQFLCNIAQKAAGFFLANKFYCINVYSFFFSVFTPAFRMCIYTVFLEIPR